MQKSKLQTISIVLLIGAIIFLGVIWWINGRDDTWLYATSAFIVLSSIFSILSERNKDLHK